MSRYCGDKESKPILDAAIHWREVALKGHGSVFSEKQLWTPALQGELDLYFVQRPDLGNGTFINKIKQQLAPVSGAAKQLAAEMMWLLYLCPSNISPSHKRQAVQTIWTWSNEPIPSASPWLEDGVLLGVGSGGTGYSIHQWRELVFCINFVGKFGKLTELDQMKYLSDAWLFAEWLMQVPEWESRQFRHMLLFLLFPDDFERVFSQNDRNSIVGHYSGRGMYEVNRMNPIEIDRELRSIRTRLEAEKGTAQLDYYMQPVKDEWKSETFSISTENVTAEHVLQAIQEINRGGIPPSAHSTKYDLVYAGKTYPPKLVLSLAVKASTGASLDRRLFSGGDDSSAFRLLRQLGYEIMPKGAAEVDFQKFFDRFLAQADEGTRLAVQGYPPAYRGLKIKVSFGSGNFARIPWIAFLGEEQAVSQGIYPVLLLFREQRQLLLCYGVSEENKADISWGEMADTSTVREWYQNKFGQNPARYGASFVRAAYDLNDSLPHPDLKSELDKVIDVYLRILQPGMPVDPLPVVAPQVLPININIARAVQAFAAALKESSVNFGTRHDELVSAFIASIITKPLVILTGLSGSGKTQIAIRLGEWLGEKCLHVAAVRPDWTGAEALFGYEDGLKLALEGRSAWTVPAPLEFMLKAVSDPQQPYLLLLDEMNLAHVERYFADVLSGMESGQPCLPNLQRGSDGCWRLRPNQPTRVPVPRNVWIVGTVNVDETTYMFSPKVLDRANTFEFRVETGDLSVSARKPRKCPVGEPELVRGLLAVAQDDGWHVAQPAPFQAGMISRLRQLHVLLSRYNLEFGHRVFYDAVRFASMLAEAGGQGIEGVLDRIVMQKVLPRLHGSRRRLEQPLLALAYYCRSLPEELASDENIRALAAEGVDGLSVKLPTSHDKVTRMLRSLRANQFASFTE